MGIEKKFKRKIKSVPYTRTITPPIDLSNDQNVFSSCLVEESSGDVPSVVIENTATIDSFDINVFMERFVEEYLSICENKIVFNQKVYDIQIRCVVADAPARAFFLNIKSHSGYSSCHKCQIVGEFSKVTRVNFPGVRNKLRTNADFALKSDQDFHNSNETLLFESIPSFGCVSNVVVDYMHAVLLGTMKKLLCLWTKRKKCPYSLRQNQIDSMSRRIMQIGHQLPIEFARKPRDLTYLARYKATEFRQLLLYTLPVAAKGILKTNYYNHFMLLHSAIRILCTPGKCIQYNSVADSLLTKFVRDVPKLYKKHEVNFNIHSLLHLCEDVKFTGATLDSFSAFKFENHLQILKKEAKSGSRVLEEIFNRNAEKKFFDKYFPLNKTNVNFDCKKKNGQFKYIIVDNVKYSKNEPNNFAYITNIEQIFKIVGIIDVTENEICFEGHEVLKLSPLYKKPVQSDLIGTHKVHKSISISPLRRIYVSKTELKKVTKFSIDNNHYFFTLVHH